MRKQSAPTNVPTRDVELLLDQKTKDKVAELKRKLAAYAALYDLELIAVDLHEVELREPPSPEDGIDQQLLFFDVPDRCAPASPPDRPYRWQR